MFNYDETIPQRNVKKNDVFFIKASSIQCFQKDIVNESYRIASCIVNDETVLAVKYIGNHMVEELETGAKICLYDFEEYYLGDYTYEMKITYVEMNLEARKHYNQNSTLIEYAYKLNEIKKQTEEYPLYIDCESINLEEPELYKREFLKGEKKIRQEVMGRLLKNASKYRKQVIKETTNLIEECNELIIKEQISEMLLKEAYNEHELYKFIKR